MIYTRKGLKIEKLKFTSFKINNMATIFRLLTIILIIGTTTLGTSAQDKIIDQIVSVVGGNIILKSDVEYMYIQNQAQGVTTDGDMKCEILENLLVDKLLLAEASLDSTIEATPSQINQQMEGQMQQYIAYLGGEKEVEKYFKKSIALVRAEMQDNIKNRLLTQQMQSKIVEKVTVTPSEVRAYYRTLKKDEIPQIPTQYEYAQITYQPDVDITEENRIKARLREFKKKIEEGTSFATMAVLYSEGPSAKDGGELPFSGRAQLDPNYAAAAYNLKGDRVSNVVKSSFGYHIIQTIEKQGEKIKTRHIILKPKVSEEALQKVAARLDSMATLIRKKELTFEQAAMMYSYDINTRNNGGIAINMNTQSSKFSIEELDPDVSKIITNLHINEISEPFRTVDENQREIYKIITLINKTEGHPANLQNDYQQLAELFMSKKKEDTLQEWILKQQEDNYISIDETYVNCNYRFKNWIK